MLDHLDCVHVSVAELWQADTVTIRDSRPAASVTIDQIAASDAERLRAPDDGVREGRSGFSNRVVQEFITTTVFLAV
jgi:hypothetical protein